MGAVGLAVWLNRPAKPPQGVLVLGGEPQREQFAAAFAQQHPHLPVWVSSGSNPEYAEWVFAEAGIASHRFRLDYEAVDTLTNFTTLVDDLKAEGIDSLYLITSDYHMRRAQLVGRVVMGSRGIQLHAIAIPSQVPAEPLEKAIADGLRAVVWLTTGSTGETWRQEFSRR